MTEATDDGVPKQVKIIIDSSVCSDGLKNAFGTRHIVATPVDTVGDLTKMLSSLTVNAVIFGQNLISSINDNIDPLKLVVLTSDLTLTDEIQQNIDGILAQEPKAFVFQLKQFIKHRNETQEFQDRLDGLNGDIATGKQKMREIELLKNAIVRNVSHELRTPLLQVKSAVSLLGEDPEDKSLIVYAQNAVARLETHVKNITMLGHSLETSMSPIILRDAIEYAKRNLTRIWTRRADAQRIQMLIEPSLSPVMADKQGLSTVLQLLIDNALKFGDAKNVDVIGRKSGDKIYVAVRDYGIGIPEDKINDIFETFYQVDDTSTRQYGGAGVGLALVKLILESHHVEIRVNSVLNEGSTFWFELDAVNFDDLS